jgi:hypothetical protein
MNIMPSISILAAGGGVIAILVALLWYVSGQARLDHARLLKALCSSTRAAIGCVSKPSCKEAAALG